MAIGDPKMIGSIGDSWTSLHKPVSLADRTCWHTIPEFGASPFQHHRDMPRIARSLPSIDWDACVEAVRRHRELARLTAMLGILTDIDRKCAGIRRRQERRAK